MDTIQSVEPRSGSGVACVLAAIAGLAVASASAAPVYQPIALSNTTGPLGPNMGAGTAFTSATGAALAQASINNQGKVLFNGGIGAAGGPPFPGVTNIGVFGWHGGLNQMHALSGDLASDGIAYSTSLLFPNIKGGPAGGHYSFRETTNAAHTGNAGVETMAARVGMVMPGTGGATLNAVSTSPQTMLNDSGVIGFRGNLNTGTGVPLVTTAAGVNNSNGLWSGTPGSLQLRARAADATGIANVTLGTIDAGVGSALMDANGQFAFTGGLQSAVAGTIVTGVTNGNDAGVFSTRTGSLQVIARRGDATPAGLANEEFRTFSTLASNSTGRIAFQSVNRIRTGATTTTTGDAVLYTDVGGSLGEVVRQNQALPASTGIANANWGGFYSDLVMNNSGALAFKATGLGGTGVTTNVDNAGIFVRSSTGTISTIMQAGTPAVDAPGTIYSTSFQSGFNFNNAGQVAWVSNLADDPNIPGTAVWTDALAPAGEFGNNLALYATDASGAVCLVVRKNDLVTLAPGDTRRVRAFAVGATAGADDGRGEFMNDSGQIVVALTFSDFSSAIMLYTVPTPGSLALLGLGGLITARRRR